MKKIIAIAAAVALCVSAMALVGCGSDNAKSASSSASTAKSSSASSADNLLIVGFDSAYPPYGFIGNNGEYTGFDLDVATEVAKRNGWDIKLEPIDWDAKDALLNAGTINAIWNGFTLEGREGKYEFSQPYMLNQQVVVVKNDSPYTALSDLAGKTVITQADSAALGVLEDEEGQLALAKTFAGGAPQTIGDYNNAFMQLESGMVDAVACDLSIAAYQMANNDGKYTIIGEPLSSEHYAVGFKLGDTARAKAVNKTLLEMYNDGTIEKLCEKYADYGLAFSNWVLTSELS